MASSSIDSRLQITRAVARVAPTWHAPRPALRNRLMSISAALAQSSTSQAQSRPESARSPQDDAPAPEQRDADSDWSLL